MTNQQPVQPAYDNPPFGALQPLRIRFGAIWKMREQFMNVQTIWLRESVEHVLGECANLEENLKRSSDEVDRLSGLLEATRAELAAANERSAQRELMADSAAGLMVERDALKQVLKETRRHMNLMTKIHHVERLHKGKPESCQEKSCKQTRRLMRIKVVVPTPPTAGEGETGTAREVAGGKGE